MDIRVGEVTSTSSAPDRRPGQSGVVEARLLAIRAPRRRPGTPYPEGQEQRAVVAGRDPANGRVLVLLIPDGSQLPDGLETGTYRVFLRFSRR